MLKNNIKTFVKEFNFVSLNDFLRLMKSDFEKLFSIVKHVLKTYQSMNKICETFQKNLTITNKNAKKLKTRVKTQKQKLIDLFKKHQHKTTQTVELKKILKFKKKKIAKFRRFRNAYRDNFDKINVKTKSLMFDKKTMQKTIENLKKRLQLAQCHDTNFNNIHIIHVISHALSSIIDSQTLTTRKFASLILKY